MELNDLLTVEDIMDYFHISNNKAYALLKTKGFPCFRIGRTYYIPRNDLNDWITSHAKHNTNIILE